jgi:hypothetical protein
MLRSLVRNFALVSQAQRGTLCALQNRDPVGGTPFSDVR